MYRRIAPALFYYVGDVQSLAFGKRSAAYFKHAPKKISLAERAGIAAVARQYRYCRVSVMAQLFKRLTEGVVLVNVDRVALGGQEKGNIHVSGCPFGFFGIILLRQCGVRATDEGINSEHRTR